jgi:hypothetical protein
MEHPNENAQPESDTEELSIQLEKLVSKVRRHLKEGGPPVDHAGILGYIDGCLADDDRDTIGSLKDTYASWHNAYWELRGWMSLAERDMHGPEVGADKP